MGTFVSKLVAVLMTLQVHPVHPKYKITGFYLITTAYIPVFNHYVLMCFTNKGISNEEIQTLKGKAIF